MRDFIEKMKAAGLADVITRPVSAEYEASNLAYKTDRMLIFENLDGRRAVMNTITDHTSLALALGMEEEGIVKALAKSTFDGAVTDAGALEGLVPADVSLLPVLKHFPKDAGKYITTGVVFSAYKGVENASIHRLLVKDKNHLIARIVEGRHTDALLKQALTDGKKLPVAIVIGAHPAVTFAACTRVPEGKEMNYAAEILKKPLPLFTCPNGIRVPDAEIILYGSITAST